MEPDQANSVEAQLAAASHDKPGVVRMPVLQQSAHDTQRGTRDWADSQAYAIDAKLEGDRGFTYEQMKPLVQQLLAERFHLKVHREMRSLPGFALEVAKKGPKLEPAEEKMDWIQILPDGLDCAKCSLHSLASVLTTVAQHPVVDKTGVAGEYRFHLHYAPRDATDSDLPSIYLALQEQVGLKLSSQQVPVEMLVVDHVDRIPTAD